MPKIEEIALQLQAGARRWVVIVFIIGLILLYPIYLLGRGLSTAWFNFSPINSYRYNGKDIINTQTISEKQLSFNEQEPVQLLDGRKLFYTLVDNRENKNIGYSPFVYQVQVFDKSGQILSDETKFSSLLPGQSRHFFTYSSDPEATNMSIKKLPDSKLIYFNQQNNPFKDGQNIEIREQKIIEKNSQNYTIRASLKNTAGFWIKKVDLILILRDVDDKIVGMQNYIIGGFGKNEERSVDLEYPKPKSGSAVNLDVRYFVDYLEDDAVRF
jgi:hypothetical protein